MPLMQFYAVSDFEISWDYIVNVGRVWWFCFCTERRFGGNYRPQFHRKINFSTLELKTLVPPKSSYPCSKVNLVSTIYNLVILTDIIVRKWKQASHK